MLKNALSLLIWYLALNVDSLHSRHITITVESARAGRGKSSRYGCYWCRVPDSSIFFFYIMHKHILTFMLPVSWPAAGWLLICLHSVVDTSERLCTVSAL